MLIFAHLLLIACRRGRRRLGCSTLVVTSFHINKQPQQVESYNLRSNSTVDLMLASQFYLYGIKNNNNNNNYLLLLLSKQINSLSLSNIRSD